MVSALLTGIFGSALTYWIGAHYFSFGLLDCALAIAASNAVGYFSLLLTLAIERKPSLRKILMGSMPKTWGVLVVLYTASLVALDPALRDIHVLLCLIAPLIWTTGLMLPLWGRTQDWVIRGEYRRSKRSPYSRKQQFARPERDVIRVES